MISEDSDRELLRGCLSGSREALEKFVLRFSDSVYRTIQHTLRPRQAWAAGADPDDLHNTVFMRLFEDRCRRLGRFEGKNGCSVSSWIRVITVRIVIDHLRKENGDALDNRKRGLPLELVPELTSGEHDPWVDLERERQLELLRDAMGDLAPRDRLFIKLHFLEELSIGEVARTMGVSENTAYSVKHRAVARLKSHVLSRARPKSLLQEAGG